MFETKKATPKSAFLPNSFWFFTASDAHGHDDVAVAVRLIGERTHLAGGLPLAYQMLD